MSESPAVVANRAGDTTEMDEADMWIEDLHLSHDMPCLRCGHGMHTYLPCSDECDCAPVVLAGSWPCDPATADPIVDTQDDQAV